MAIPTKDQAMKRMQDYVIAFNSLKKIEANMEAEIQQVRENYQLRIADHKKVIVECFDSIQRYAEDKKEEEFSRRKSQDWTHGVIGFRIGTPRVKFDRGFAKKALELVRELGLPFTRTKEELDKDKIISSREDHEVMGKLKKCGINVIQDEAFFIEVKEEGIVNGS